MCTGMDPASIQGALKSISGAGPAGASTMRAPTDSEQKYFKTNPHVAGMATEDDRVVLNPFSALSDKEKSAVVKNEMARIFMRNSKERPSFALTDEQKRRFGSYSANEKDVRETVAARLLSGDPSAGTPTTEQSAYVDHLRAAMAKTRPTILRGGR